MVQNDQYTKYKEDGEGRMDPWVERDEEEDIKIEEQVHG